jgi:hypothetical protein
MLTVLFAAAAVRELRRRVLSRSSGWRGRTDGLLHTVMAVAMSAAHLTRVRNTTPWPPPTPFTPRGSRPPTGEGIAARSSSKELYGHFWQGAMHLGTVVMLLVHQ